MKRATYHHGHLREALIGTGIALARTGGPEAVQIREAARRLGVSAPAAYRHFTGREELLRAVRVAALELLGGRMRAERAGDDPDDPVARFRALGAGYVAFATEEPGLFRTLVGRGSTVAAGQATSALDPYVLLAEALDRLVADGILPEARRPGADVTAWAAVHGLAALLVDGLLPARDAHRCTAELLDTVARGLLKPGQDPPEPSPPGVPPRHVD